jgi:hypothetical protein
LLTISRLFLFLSLSSVATGIGGAGPDLFYIIGVDCKEKRILFTLKKG